MSDSRSPETSVFFMVRQPGRRQKKDRALSAEDFATDYQVDELYCEHHGLELLADDVLFGVKVAHYGKLVPLQFRFFGEHFESLESEVERQLKRVQHLLDDRFYELRWELFVVQQVDHIVDNEVDAPYAIREHDQLVVRVAYAVSGFLVRARANSADAREVVLGRHESHGVLRRLVYGKLVSRRHGIERPVNRCSRYGLRHRTLPGKDESFFPVGQK